jgi:hypothetical protein
VELLLWVGLLAAPLAWTVHLVAGFGATLAACNGGGREFSLDAWEVALTVAAVCVALAGQAAAVLAWRATRGGRPSGAPPAGRIHFLADAALLSNSIFLVAILLGGVAAVHFAGCGQA